MAIITCIQHLKCSYTQIMLNTQQTVEGKLTETQYQSCGKQKSFFLYKNCYCANVVVIVKEFNYVAWNGIYKCKSIQSTGDNCTIRKKIKQRKR